MLKEKKNIFFGFGSIVKVMHIFPISCKLSSWKETLFRNPYVTYILNFLAYLSQLENSIAVAHSKKSEELLHIQ